MIPRSWGLDSIFHRAVTIIGIIYVFNTGNTTLRGVLETLTRLPSTKGVLHGYLLPVIVVTLGTPRVCYPANKNSVR